MARLLTPVLAALACALVVACGEDPDPTLSEGDCTDVDPTAVIEALEPKIVDCEAENARSKVVAKTDDAQECRGGGYIKDNLDVYYCLEALPGSFAERLREADRKGRESGRDLQKELDELGEELGKKGPPER